MASALQTKNFLWISCVINAVTVFSVILQLTFENPGMAFEIDGTIEHNYTQNGNMFDIIENVNETVLLSTAPNGGGVFKNSKPNTAIAHLKGPHRTLGLEEGSSTNMKCQLRDGSEWKTCKWKHGHKSLSIVRDPSG